MRSHQALLRSRWIVATSALIALSACSGQKQTPAPQPPEVSVVTVRRGSVPLSLELPGRTSAYLVAQVRARVDGIVLKRDFKEGSDVKASQRLYLIDPAPYRAALDSAVGTLEQAQANIASTTAQAERYKVLSAGERGEQAGLRQRGRLPRPGGRRRRLRQGGRRDREDQSGLHPGPLADHRPHRDLAGHRGGLRAGAPRPRSWRRSSRSIRSTWT